MTAFPYSGKKMGLDYIQYMELPRKLTCQNCGSTHIKISGARKVIYELEEQNGEKINEEQVDIEWDVVYGVECVDCGNYADPDEIEVEFGYA